MAAAPANSAQYLPELTVPLKRVVETGEAIWSEDLMLPLLRSEMQEGLRYAPMARV